MRAQDVTARDLSQAFGHPATSSLRGLLPPRHGATWWSEPRGDDGGPGTGPIPRPRTAEPESEDLEPADDELDDEEPEDASLEDGVPDGASSPAAPRREGTRAASRRPVGGASRTGASAEARRAGRARVTSRDHVELLVLLSLRQGPTDGRGVIARLREISGGQLEVGEQTVHVTLHRLARNRLLGRAPAPAGRRRPYTLTAAGERAARSRLRGWQALRRGVDAVARAGG